MSQVNGENSFYTGNKLLAISHFFFFFAIILPIVRHRFQNIQTVWNLYLKSIHPLVFCFAFFFFFYYIIENYFLTYIKNEALANNSVNIGMFFETIP